MQAWRGEGQTWSRRGPGWTHRDSMDRALRSCDCFLCRQEVSYSLHLVLGQVWEGGSPRERAGGPWRTGEAQAGGVRVEGPQIPGL